MVRNKFSRERKLFNQRHKWIKQAIVIYRVMDADIYPTSELLADQKQYFTDIAAVAACSDVKIRTGVLSLSPHMAACDLITSACTLALSVIALMPSRPPDIIHTLISDH